MVIHRAVGTRRVVGIVLVALLALRLLGTQEAAAQAPACQFVLGFAELRAMLGPEVVGECREDQWAVEGGAFQQMSRGLLVWRQSDGAAAFVDVQTELVHIKGPLGLQTRRLEEHFDWELAGGGSLTPLDAAPAAPAVVVPAPQPQASPSVSSSQAASRCPGIVSGLTLQYSTHFRDPRHEAIGQYRSTMETFCRQAAADHGGKGVACFESAAWRGMPYMGRAAGRLVAEATLGWYRSCVEAP